MQTDTLPLTSRVESPAYQNYQKMESDSLLCCSNAQPNKEVEETKNDLSFFDTLIQSPLFQRKKLLKKASTSDIETFVKFCVAITNGELPVSVNDRYMKFVQLISNPIISSSDVRNVMIKRRKLIGEIIEWIFKG